MWFDLKFTMWSKSVNTNLQLLRHQANSKWNISLENRRPRYILNEVTKTILVCLFITKNCTMGGYIMHSYNLKVNRNRCYNMIRRTKGRIGNSRADVRSNEHTGQIYSIQQFAVYSIYSSLSIFENFNI